MSLRGLAMLNGGSQTCTLKGYQGFSSAWVAGTASARKATPPNKTKPSVVPDCFMPLSLFMGHPAVRAGAPLLFVVEPAAAACRRRPGDCCASPAHCKFRKEPVLLSENPMSLSLRQIRYFIASAEAGKLSLAASQLGVSQSAVTEAIKALEQETGVSLLHRHGKGIELTVEGNQFLRHARAVVAAVSDATQAPRQARSGIAGSFSLAVTFTVAGYFLPAPLARFRRIFPGVEPLLHELNRADIEQGLVDGRIDLALFLVSNLRNAAAIDTEVLIQSKRRLWLPVNHPLLQP